MSYSKKSKKTWTELLKILRQNDSVLILSHVNPDGDSIGSQLAFSWYLKTIGKNVYIYNRDPVPNKLAFLEDSGLIRNGPFPSSPFNISVVIDSSNLDRLGIDKTSIPSSCLINIDHHEDNTFFADCNIVESAAAATGEILYRFFSDNNISYPPKVAEALYTAIFTDTGGFRFSNTTSSVLQACANLSENGADCSRIYKNVYASFSPNGMRLLSRVWSSLSFHFDNRVCIMELPLEIIDELGADYGDSEGIAESTIISKKVEVGMLIKYLDNNTHFSLRSNGRIDVGKIARKIPGGGGHNCAAGCTLQLPMEAAKSKMLDIIKKELD